MVKIEDLCNVTVRAGLPDDFLESEVANGKYIYPVYSNGNGGRALSGYCTKPYVTKPAITYCSVGTIGNPLIRYEPFTPTAALQTIIPNNESDLDIRYLKYVLETAKFELKNSTMKYVTGKIIRNYEIVVPTLEIQKRIANFLDILCEFNNNIGIGLPAEIQLRQQQLQYYLNRFCCPDFSKQ